MEKKIREILGLADIKINGNRPQDIKVHDSKFYNSVFSGGSLALGEAYVDGMWDCDDLEGFFYKVLRADLQSKVKKSSYLIMKMIQSFFMNLQSNKRAFQVGERHYDLGNDLYEAMLDKRMVYTCAYWRNAKDLDKAQEDKLDLVCRKLGLKPGMTVLDIGCGWGSFAKFAAEKYKVKVVGVTVSKEQVLLAREKCKVLPVKIILEDYREINGKFDRIVSLGMFEHVGPKNYRDYMQVVRRCLKDEGLFLLHTIGSNFPSSYTDPWIEKYIFPNSYIPSASQITKSYEKLLVMEDWHNFGDDYAKTLVAWDKRFRGNWHKLKDKYGEKFYRMWHYYLLCCAGAFRAREIQLWQIVFSKRGVDDGYKSIR